MAYATLYLRLVAHCELAEGQNENGCWIWTGTRDSKGYGRLAMRKPGKKNPTGVRAHRAMMSHLMGRELHPDRETVEHKCFETSCINPDHLELMTRAQNSAARWNRF